MTELAGPAPHALVLEDVQRAVAAMPDAAWDALRGRSIFMTGGTGFIGKWLLEMLCLANRTRPLGLRVMVLTRTPDDFLRRWPHLAADAAVSLHQGDVVSFSFPRQPVDLVVHAALPVAADAPDLVRTAEEGLARVCDFARNAGAKRLLHVSSGAVYGAQPAGGPVTESAVWTEPAPNDYTRAKRAAETVCAGPWPFEVVIARCFAFVGPMLDGASGSAAAQFIEAAARGQDIVIQGDGTPVRSYLYAADMARWLLTLLAVAPAGMVCNVGSDEAITIRELAGRVAAVAGGAQVTTLGAVHRGLAGNSYVPDTSLARHALGLENTLTLDEAIQRTLAWRRSVQALDKAAP